MKQTIIAYFHTYIKQFRKSDDISILHLKLFWSYVFKLITAIQGDMGGRRERERLRQTDRQRKRQTDRQGETQRDRQTERERGRERERDRGQAGCLSSAVGLVCSVGNFSISLYI